VSPARGTPRRLTGTWSAMSGLSGRVAVDYWHRHSPASCVPQAVARSAPDLRGPSLRSAPLQLAWSRPDKCCSNVECRENNHCSAWPGRAGQSFERAKISPGGSPTWRISPRGRSVWPGQISCRSNSSTQVTTEATRLDLWQRKAQSFDRQLIWSELDRLDRSTDSSFDQSLIGSNLQQIGNLCR